MSEVSLIERRNDELFMEEALRAAQRALEAGEVPVGAVVVCDGKIIGRGWNRNITDQTQPPMPRSSRCAKPVPLRKSSSGRLRTVCYN